jgi:hypothetical protein
MPKTKGQLFRKQTRDTYFCLVIIWSERKTLDRDSATFRKRIIIPLVWISDSGEHYAGVFFMKIRRRMVSSSRKNKLKKGD